MTISLVRAFHRGPAKPESAESTVGAISTKGQATVEFCIVLSAFLVILLAGSLFWQALDDGLLVSHALAAESHNISDGGTGGFADAFIN